MNSAEASIIVICHGSRNPDANQAHNELCEAIGDELGKKVEPAFLEMTEPKLGDVIATEVSNGAKTVLVLPHFLHPGNHVNSDIPALINQARSQHPGVEIKMGPLFGADPAVVSLLARQAQHALADT